MIRRSCHDATVDIFQIQHTESNEHSNYMSKSRRELFEDQLKDLQNDIASLSQKLAVPSLVATNRIALTNGSKGNSLNLLSCK